MRNQNCNNLGVLLFIVHPRTFGTTPPLVASLLHPVAFLASSSASSSASSPAGDICDHAVDSKRIRGVLFKLDRAIAILRRVSAVNWE